MQYPVFEVVQRTVDAALAADDAGAAIDAVRPVARALAAEHGADFRALVTRIPSDAWHDDAVIASALGSSYRAAGSPRGPSAIGYFQAAEAGLAAAGSDADADRIAVWLGHAAALRMLGRLRAAESYLERARDLVGQDVAIPVTVRVELVARCMLESGLVGLHLGSLDAARSDLEFAHGLAADHLTRAERVESLGGLALAEYVQSGLESASRHSADARALAARTGLWRSGYAAPALVAQILIAVERDDLGNAAAIEDEMLTAARDTDWEPFAFIAAGYQRFADGRLPEGLDYLQRARDAYRSWSPAGLGPSVEALLRASLLVHLDQGDEAWAILRELPPHEHHILCPARIIAQLRLRHGDLRGASRAIEECERIADDHSPRTMVEVRMLRAAIELERGQFARSDVAFDRALVTIARTGSRAPLRLIPAGTLAGLAARAADRDHAAEEMRILDRIAEAGEGATRLIEPLSTRELLVLAEVEKGSTVASIAAALFISPNTVKTHLRRLYRKLGVTTRADAIRKAKSLGLGRSVTRDSPE